MQNQKKSAESSAQQLPSFRDYLNIVDQRALDAPLVTT
jgi:hypothetical protein